MLTMTPESSKHPNITEINYTLPNVNSESSDMFAHMNKEGDGFRFPMLKKYLPVMARDMYKLPHIKKLYERRKEFDVVVVDYLFSKVSVECNVAMSKQVIPLEGTKVQEPAHPH